jgi:hypothetical protein
MAYPLSNTFSSAPPNGYLESLGGMTSAHNASLQSVDISGDGQSILRFNEAPTGNFWFQADVEFLSDAAGLKHIGLWMTTGNGSEGYRFSHYTDHWRLDGWGSNFSTQYFIEGSYAQEGQIPPTGGAAVTPTFNVGQRLILRCDVTSGAYLNGKPNDRVIQFKVGSVVVCRSRDAGVVGDFMPGVFIYGGSARIHSISGGTPSALATLPQFAGATYAPVDRLQSVSNSLAITNSSPMNSPMPVVALRRNIHFGGAGRVFGTVKQKGSPSNIPLARRVQLFSQDNNHLVAETWSNEQGDYVFENVDGGQRYMAIAYDHTEAYRAVIADNLTPEVT